MVVYPLPLTRCDIETCRMLVHRAAERMDEAGNKDPRTRQLLAMVKAHVPVTVQTLADRCIQAHGAMGLCQDTPLAAAFLAARGLRLADGPDEVHLRTAAAIELRMQPHSPLFGIGHYPVPEREPGGRVFRRSTDPIAPHARRVLEQASRL